MSRSGRPSLTLMSDSGDEAPLRLLLESPTEMISTTNPPSGVTGTPSIRQEDSTVSSWRSHAAGTETRHGISDQSSHRGARRIAGEICTHANARDVLDSGTPAIDCEDGLLDPVRPGRTGPLRPCTTLCEPAAPLCAMFPRDMRYARCT